jgi:signal peptidase
MESSYVVTSGSMEPAIDVGAVILVERVDTATLGTGDVITFRRDRTARPVTHRVISVQDQGNDRSFLTKGDANEEPDREPIPASAVVGKVALVVPLIGYVVTYAQTDMGVILLVVLPGVALLSSELWRLHEIRRGSAADPHSADGDGGGPP